MFRRYGLWLITSPRSTDDPRIWREDKNSYSLPTLFQRKVGVKYVRDGALRFPNSKGGYCNFWVSHPPKSIQLLLKGVISAKPVSRARLSLIPAHQALLVRSTGYVILWVPQLKHCSLQNIATFVGTVLVKENELP